MTTQTTVTYLQIADAIADTLAAAAGLGTARVQSLDELTEGMNDTPTLQVYLEEFGQNATGNVDRSTFKGGVRQTDILIHADLYATPRAHLGQDMADAVALVEQLQAILEAQDTKPYFGLEGIKAFSWTARRVNFDYAGQLFLGFRFMIRVRVF